MSTEQLEMLRGCILEGDLLLNGKKQKRGKGGKKLKKKEKKEKKEKKGENSGEKKEKRDKTHKKDKKDKKGKKEKKKDKLIGGNIILLYIIIYETSYNLAVFMFSVTHYFQGDISAPDLRPTFDISTLEENNLIGGKEIIFI